MPTAIVTGASRGLGLAFSRALAERGWDLVVDARGPAPLEAARRHLLATGARVSALPGDVTDTKHRHALVAAAQRHGGLDLLVNNAGTLGPGARPPLASYPLDALAEVYAANVIAPLGLIQLALPLLARSANGTIVNVTSDAGAEAYAGWGGYGSAKAALEQLSGVLAVEHPGLRIYAADPGDMRTRMHQQAFPDEDISDRPPPEDSVTGLLALLDAGRESGRYDVSPVAA